MYGILAACVAVMAMFLGLFAMAVEPEADGIGDRVISGPQKAGPDQTAQSAPPQR